MKNYITILLLFACGFLTAQPVQFEEPCGTPTFKRLTRFITLNGVAAVPGDDWVAIIDAQGFTIAREPVINLSGYQGCGDAPGFAMNIFGENEFAFGCPVNYGASDGEELTVILWQQSSGLFFELFDKYTFSNPNFPYPPAMGANGACTVQDAFPSTVYSVELTELSATTNGKTVSLNWATSSETENSHFEVQRSYSAGSDFVTIGTVAGNGNSGDVNRYVFTDNNADNGTVYYRLNQVDFDGTSTFSPVVSAELSVAQDRSVSVYPNPTTAGSSLSLRLGGNWTEGATQVRMLDASGRQVAEWTALGSGSLNTVLPTVAAGLYQVVATDGKERRTTRVVVR